VTFAFGCKITGSDRILGSLNEQLTATTQATIPPATRYLGNPRIFALPR
jgi:hypothetical protein